MKPLTPSQVSNIPGINKVGAAISTCTTDFVNNSSLTSGQQSAIQGGNTAIKEAVLLPQNITNELNKAAGRIDAACQEKHISKVTVNHPKVGKMRS